MYFTLADASAWSGLVEVDRLTVLVVVDNETDGISSPCMACDPSRPGWSGAEAYRSEFSALTQAFLDGRLEELDMRRVLHAGHGLSLLLTAECDDDVGPPRRLLIDGGPESALWASNAERLGLDGTQLGAAVLSHWHPDHSVGLAGVAEWASTARQRAMERVTEMATEKAAGDLPNALHTIGLEEPSAIGLDLADEISTGDGGDSPRKEEDMLEAQSVQTTPLKPGPSPQTPKSEFSPQTSKPGPSPQAFKPELSPLAPTPGPSPHASRPELIPLIFDLHPDRPLRRGFQTPDGTNVPFNEDVRLDDLKLPGCRVQLHREAHTLLDGRFFVSGPIPRRSGFEQGLPSHVILIPSEGGGSDTNLHIGGGGVGGSSRYNGREADGHTLRSSLLSPEGRAVSSGGSQGGGVKPLPRNPLPRGEWVKDPLIEDERYIAVRIRGRGAVVFSSCSHAGIVNVATHASYLSEGCGGQGQLLGVVGGFHLSGRECEPRISQTVSELRKLLDGVSGVVLVGHCTGWRAKAALAEGLTMGRFQPLAVGGQYVFKGM